MSLVCAVLTAAILAVGPTAHAFEKPAARGPTTVSINGSPVSGASITGSVEGAPPPKIEGEGPPLEVIVRLNGWIIANPDLVWSPEEQAWTFTIDVPEGQEGATLSVTVIGGGGVATASSRVGV